MFQHEFSVTRLLSFYGWHLVNCVARNDGRNETRDIACFFQPKSSVFLRIVGDIIADV
jgi:hypothetical protein